MNIICIFKYISEEYKEQWDKFIKIKKLFLSIHSTKCILPLSVYFYAFLYNFTQFSSMCCILKMNVYQCESMCDFCL